MHRPDFFVLTGGPGVGKTTLLRALETAGERVVDETARAVIRHELANGGNGVPWLDRVRFCRLCAERDVAIFDGLAAEPGRIFFDRGIMDSVGANGVPPWPELEEAVRTRRYNRRVFILPPWREIYEADAERKQDWTEAEATFERIHAMLISRDYEPVVVPKTSVEERVRFVLTHAASCAAQVSTNAFSSTKSPGDAIEPSS